MRCRRMCSLKVAEALSAFNFEDTPPDLRLTPSDIDCVFKIVSSGVRSGNARIDMMEDLLSALGFNSDPEESV